MWDIKVFVGYRLGLGSGKYYLNHVGYKEQGEGQGKQGKARYYLNHVGYKVTCRRIF